jgi:hypothetical protein
MRKSGEGACRFCAALPLALAGESNRPTGCPFFFFLPRCSAQWNGNPVACDLRSQSRRVQLRYEHRHVIFQFQPCPIQSNPTHRRVAKLHVARYCRRIKFITTRWSIGAYVRLPRLRLRVENSSLTEAALSERDALETYYTNKQRTSFVSLIQRVDLSYLIYIY